MSRGTKNPILTGFSETTLNDRSVTTRNDSWSPDSWTTRPHAQETTYRDIAAVEASVNTLK